MPKKSSKKTENRNFNINKDLTGHEWRQRGPFLVCESCDLTHSVYVGTGKMLVGMNDKGPVFEKR